MPNRLDTVGLEKNYREACRKMLQSIDLRSKMHTVNTEVAITPFITFNNKRVHDAGLTEPAGSEMHQIVRTNCRDAHPAKIESAMCGVQRLFRLSRVRGGRQSRGQAPIRLRFRQS